MWASVVDSSGGVGVGMSGYGVKGGRHVVGNR